MSSGFYIVGYCGEIKYFLQIKKERKFLDEPIWQGLKDNATKFRSHLEAEAAMKAIEHLVKIHMEIK